MKLHLNKRADRPLVHSWAADAPAPGKPAGARVKRRVKIGEVWYRNSVLLTMDGVAPWAVDGVAALTEAHFEAVAALQAEVMILGTGARLIFPPPQITRPLMARRMGFEVMDTAAACRTYNVLVADGRPVVAGLIM